MADRENPRWPPMLGAAMRSPEAVAEEAEAVADAADAHAAVSDAAGVGAAAGASAGASADAAAEAAEVDHDDGESFCRRRKMSKFAVGVHRRKSPSKFAVAVDFFAFQF